MKIKSKLTVKQQWLNIKEACTYAGVSRHTMTRWMDQGLKVARFGKRYLFKKQNIDAFIEGFEVDVDMDDLEKKVMAGLSGLKTGGR